MPQEIVIFDWNLANALSQSTYLPRTPLPVQVRLEVDLNIFKLISQDPLLHQQIVDACQREFMACADLINTMRAKIETLIREDIHNPRNRLVMTLLSKKKIILPNFAEKYQNTLEQFTQYEIGQSLKRAEAAAKHQWENLAEQRQEYREYKGKVKAKVVLGVTGVGLGVTGAILTIPTGGVSLILAVVAAWRAVVDGFKMLYNLSKEAEKVGKETRDIMKALKGKYDRKTKGQVAVQEVIASTINALFQSEMKNISKAKGACELWKDKLNHISIIAHDLAISLNDLLEKQEALIHWILAMDIWLRNNARYYNSSRNKTLLKKWQKLEKTKTKRDTLDRQVRKMLADNKIATFYERAQTGLEAQSEAAQALVDLQNKSPSWTQKYDKYAALLVNVGVAGGADTLSFIGAKAALDWSLAGATAANDLVTNIRDLCE